MGTVKKVIYFIVGLIITMAFIGEATGYFNKSMAMSKTTKTSYDSTLERISNSTYSEFENTTVSGADAISAIRLYADDTFTVTVKTKRSSQSYNKSSGYNATSINDTNYIEPTAKFKSVLGTNELGTVNSITLTQN